MDIPGLTEQPTEYPPERSPVTPKVYSSGLGEQAGWGGPDPLDAAETFGPFLPGGWEGADVNMGQGTQKLPETFAEPLTTVQYNVDVPAQTAPSLPILSLQCRICDAPPTVATRPTVTVCGHLFCSEYVLRIPGARSLDLL